MSMNLTVYMVTGYRIDRDDLWNNFSAAAEIIETADDQEISIVSTEGKCNDAIVGIVAHQCGVYDDGHPESFAPPLVSHVKDKLNELGFQVGTEDICHYFYGTWG